MNLDVPCASGGDVPRESCQTDADGPAASLSTWPALIVSVALLVLLLHLLAVAITPASAATGGTTRAAAPAASAVRAAGPDCVAVLADTRHPAYADCLVQRYRALGRR